MKKKKSRGGGILFVLLLVGGGVVAWGATKGGWFRAEEEVALAGAEVRRGDLLISETVRGNLEAKESISLRSEIEREVTILYLIDEGTKVSEGDLVCELDVSELEDRKISQEIEVKSAEATFTKAREQYEIQVIQNETDLADAKLQEELARMDLEKYVVTDGEWTNELAASEEAIALKKEELVRAEDVLRNTQILFDKGFAQALELEGDTATVRRIGVEIDQAKRDRDLKVAYEHDRRLKELGAAVKTAERNIEKTRKQAIARLADFEAERESASYKLKREQDSLARINQQVGKAKIYAPEEGIVVYGRKKSRWGGGEPVEQGGTVYERQEIISMPKPGGMTVEASLHETRLKLVKEGQNCRISIDALPGRSYEGFVSFVAVLPDSGSYWANPNQRIYKAEITIEDAVPEMRPGMSCGIEILVENLVDVLYVPRQAVFFDGDRTVAFVNNGEEVETREVQVGQDNSRWVSISEGLSEGEFVLLTPPADFDPAPRATSRPEGSEASAELAEKAPKVLAEQTKRTRSGESGGERSGGGRKPSAEQIEAIRKSRGKQGGGAGGGGPKGGGGAAQAGAATKVVPAAVPAAVEAGSLDQVGAGQE